MGIPDNFEIWEDHELEQERSLENRPKCCHCGNPIQDDYLYKIHGGIYCEDCVSFLFREAVENYGE